MSIRLLRGGMSNQSTEYSILVPISIEHHVILEGISIILLAFMYDYLLV